MIMHALQGLLYSTMRPRANQYLSVLNMLVGPLILMGPHWAHALR